MDRRRVLAAVGIVVAVVAAVFAVVLWRAGIDTSSYPPLQLDDKTVAGPYTLTRYDGGDIAGANLLTLVAVLAAAYSVRALVAHRRPGTNNPPSGH